MKTQIIKETSFISMLTEKERLTYILVYKPTIFGAILTFKLWGSAYMRVMPQPESTVSMTAICQRRSLCVSHTRRGPLVVTRATWMHGGERQWGSD